MTRALASFKADLVYGYTMLFGRPALAIA